MTNNFENNSGSSEPEPTALEQIEAAIVKRVANELSLCDVYNKSIYDWSRIEDEVVVMIKTLFPDNDDFVKEKTISVIEIYKQAKRNKLWD